MPGPIAAMTALATGPRLLRQRLRPTCSLIKGHTLTNRSQDSSFHAPTDWRHDSSISPCPGQEWQTPN